MQLEMILVQLCAESILFNISYLKYQSNMYIKHTHTLINLHSCDFSLKIFVFKFKGYFQKLFTYG